MGQYPIVCLLGGSECFSISGDQCATMLLSVGLAKRLDRMIIGMEAGGRLMMEKMKVWRQEGD